VTSSPESFEIEGADGKPLRGDLYQSTLAAAAIPAATRVAILSHGFRGYKDWGFLPLLALHLAEAGISAVTFNFSGSGIADRDGAFAEPERYRASTYGEQLTDLGLVVEWAIERLRPERASSVSMDDPRIGLVGHSRGGAISILHARSDPRVRCVAALASPARIGVWPESYFEAWKRGEPALTHDFRTGLRLPLGPELYRDLEAHRSRYDVFAAVESLRVPLLIVQGDRDRAVPLEEAKELASYAPAVSTELRVIEGAGHNFQAGDKIRRTPPQLSELLALVTAWMRRWLFADL